ncbi:homoserine kinase [Jatrophihabitans endophyticus]|uniref:homoserine kinase n=1 Tax=Jatrophihabitans endophyticus TaxID=1206085 RepID=UPI0026EBCA35|nr:homoserine kinase [Jatrophihabitans endophyticus]
MTFVEGPVRVRVPATSANLGPGFDALGLALGLHDEVVGRVTSEGLEVDVRGEGAGAGPQVARDETHLVVRSMRAAFAALGESPPGLAIECDNAIPHSRGLGSSSAAICAGVLLARGLVDGGDELLPDAAVLALANELEGHPDNVAPCLLGGLTVAWIDDGVAHAVRREPDPSVAPIALIPPFTASTELARGLLPTSVPHADAAFAAGRSALLVAALTGSPGALFAATEDRLHQAYRAPAMAESAALVAALRGEGLPAVISGAGPTVLILTADGSPSDERLRSHTPEGWQVLAPGIDTSGAVTER